MWFILAWMPIKRLPLPFLCLTLRVRWPHTCLFTPQSLRAMVLYHVLETESRFLYSLYLDGERLNMYSNHGLLVKKG